MAITAQDLLSLPSLHGDTIRKNRTDCFGQILLKRISEI